MGKELIGDRLKDHLVCLITPFDADGALDFEAARHNVRLTMAMPGCGGIYFGSVYQEFWTMTVEERIRLLEVVADEVNGRMPIVAGVSSPSVEDTVRMAGAADVAGASFLMVWPPYWGPRSRDGVRRYYHAVAAQVSLPMFVYSTTLPEIGFHLDTPTLAALADEIPAICGVKDGTGNVTTFLNMTAQLGDRLAVGTPFEEYWAVARMAYPDRCPDFIIGASRPMYMQTAERPYLADMLALLRRGEHEAAFRELEAISPLVEGQMAAFREGVHPVSLVKEACGLLGQRGTHVRAATPRLTDGERRKVRQLLTATGLLGSGDAALARAQG